MRENEALRLIVAIERQRRAARRIAGGTFDERSALDYVSATLEEGIALHALDEVRGISPRRSTRSPPS